MSFYEEQISSGETPDDLKQYIYDRSGDFINSQLLEGESEEDVLDYIAERSGMPLESFLGEDEGAADKPTTNHLEDISGEPTEEYSFSKDMGKSAEAWFTGKEQTVRGAMNPVLKLLSAGERWLESMGITDDKDDFLEALTSNKEAIKTLEQKTTARKKEIGLDPKLFGVQPTGYTNADVAEFAVEWMPTIMLTKLRQAAMGEGLYQGVLSYGSGDSQAKSAQVATETAMMIYAGGKLIEKTVSTVLPMFQKAVHMGKNIASDDMANLKNITGIKEADLQKLIDETPEDMLPIVLAEAGGDRTRPLLIQALNDSDNATIGKYIDRITNRAKSAYKSIGGDTSQQTQAIAEEAYGEMVKGIKSLDAKIDFGDGFRGKMEKLKKVSFDDATDKKIEGFLNQLKDEPITDLSTLLKAQKEINEFARSARNSDQAYKLRELSRDMTSFIEDNPGISDGIKAYISNTKKIYAESMNQKTLLEIFDKHSGKSGTGYSRERAVNWASLKDDLLKESAAGNLNMNAEETNTLLNIAKQFDKKIGNLDDVLFGGVNTKAGKDQATGIATTLKGRFDQLVTKNMFNVIYQNIPGLDTTQLRDMQILISKSISKSNSARDLARNIIKNKNTPKKLREDINDSLSKIKEDFIPKTKAEKNKVLEIDEIIDAQPNPPKQGEVIDTELVPKQIANSERKQIETRVTGKQLPQAKNLEGKDAIDEGYATRAKEDRIRNLTETTREKVVREPEQKLLETTEKITGTDKPAGLNKDVEIRRERRKEIVEKTSTKIRNRVFRNLPEEFSDMEDTKGFVLEALENGNILAKNKKGAKELQTAKGGVFNQQGDLIQIPHVSTDTNAVQNQLSRAGVNRIKAGKATKEDLDNLRTDVEELRQLDSQGEEIPF